MLLVFSHIDPLELVQLTLYLWYAHIYLSVIFFSSIYFFSLLFAWPTFYGFVFIFEQQSSKLEIYHKKLKTKKDLKKPLYRHFGHEKYQCYKKKNQINSSLSIHVAQIIQINATTKNFVYHAISIVWL